MTNYVKTKIDKTQQNSKCSLYGDREETINHISESIKLAQKEYKTRHDWVRKVIHKKLCKKFKLDHTNKWYMHNSESVMDNETHKALMNFEIQTVYLILARRSDLVIVKKETSLLKSLGLLIF